MPSKPFNKKKQQRILYSLRVYKNGKEVVRSQSTNKDYIIRKVRDT
jgi:hypothetical protein